MDIIFERDSVCAGDDVYAPNRKIADFDGRPLLSELCGGEHALRYLPAVSGAKTKWSVIIDSSIVAYVWHSYASIREIEVELLEQDKTTDAERIFFQYDSQHRHFLSS
ncbi:MAG: hypothetical protein ABJ327_15520 [Litoreibacter sp.]